MGEKIIETVVVEALESISVLRDKVFPLGAPEEEELPFVVYISEGATEDDSLSGWLGSYHAQMEINVLCGTYGELKALAAQAAEVLKTITEASVSISEDFPEVYEPEIRAYRKIINIKLMY